MARSTIGVRTCRRAVRLGAVTCSRERLYEQAVSASRVCLTKERPRIGSLAASDRAYESRHLVVVRCGLDAGFLQSVDPVAKFAFVTGSESGQAQAGQRSMCAALRQHPACSQAIIRCDARRWRTEPSASTRLSRSRRTRRRRRSPFLSPWPHAFESAFARATSRGQWGLFGEQAG